MRKIIFTIIAVLLLLICPIYKYNTKANETIIVNSKSSILIEPESGTVLYTKNEKYRLPIASMTKIMLLNLCFENINNGKLKLDEKVTVSKTASGMGGSQVYLAANKTYCVKDLIKSVIIASANDASVALAERLYGSEANCVEQMNEKCREWNLSNTLFSNCTGLPKPTQYSSAEDVAIMLTHLIKHKEYFTYSKIWMDELKHSEDKVIGLTNTNKLIKFYEGCDGGKTGFTSESGFCLAATAKRGGLRLISVVINAPNSKTRFSDVTNMFNYGFDNFTNKMVVDSDKPLELEVKIGKAKTKNVTIKAKDDVFVFTERLKDDKITIDFKPNNAIAPIEQGETVGHLRVFVNGVEYKTVEVVTCQKVEAKSYFDYVYDIGSKWI